VVRESGVCEINSDLTKHVFSKVISGTLDLDSAADPPSPQINVEDRGSSVLGPAK